MTWLMAFLPTTVTVSWELAWTVAERGAPVSRDISPKNCPFLMVATCVDCSPVLISDVGFALHDDEELLSRFPFPHDEFAGQIDAFLCLFRQRV